MPKSYNIIKAILKDVQAFVLEKYEDENIELSKTNIISNRQLFDASSASGWIDKITSSTLYILSILSERTSVQYPNILLTIRHDDRYGWDAGDIELQAQRFGSISEPGAINKIKTEIGRGIENTPAEAKLKYEHLPDPGRSS